MGEGVDLTEQVLGEFRVMRRLGGGGMADVYLAEQQSLGRHVALKVMRPSLMSGSDDTMVKRFKMEAMTAAGLNHANIVQVYTIGEEGDYHYIAQELVQGKNLAQLLKSKGKADIGSCLHIMRQMASALRASGKAGIIHRDIKPENIMLTKRGEVKITDFGLAQLTEKKSDGNLTEDGMTLGTPLYMSPEQVKGSELDLRSDIYSFGVTCYHMLTGAPPYSGATAMAIAIQHVNSTPEPILERNPRVPAPIAQMVHRMMSRDREYRYADADQVNEDIRKLVSAKKAGQDLNYVRLPVLAELESRDPNTKTASVSKGSGATTKNKAASSKSKSKSKSKPSSGSSKMRLPTASVMATKRTKPKPSAPGSKSSPAATPSKPTRERDGDDDEDFPGREPREVEELDMTPMIDVTFLLLIFFMITASFTLQKSLNVPPPDPDEGASTQPVTDEMQKESIEIRIDQENTILVEGVAVETHDEIVEAIETKMGEEGKTAILLEAEPESTHRNAILVFDAAQAAKVQTIRQKLPSAN